MRFKPQSELTMNLLLLTYDSCRYDVLRDAHTPVIDRYSPICLAKSPATFTYASHHAFFVGILPNTVEDIPYFNRFNRQLFGLFKMGEPQVSANSYFLLQSDWNMVQAFSDKGYQTVGAGAMNWFRQKSLTHGFEKFLLTGRDANRQVDYLLSEIDVTQPFFGFINFGETHAPYSFEGKQDVCAVDVRARAMKWPPQEEGKVGVDCDAYAHQVSAAEFLDRQLARLIANLPGDTVVVVTADHGECFGEDGYWGHGINHDKVFDVPLAIFKINKKPI